MAEYVRTKAGNKTIYTNKTDNRQVPADDLPKALKEELDLADEGTVVDDSTVESLDGDGVTDADGNPVKSKAEEQAEETARAKAEEDAARAKAAEESSQARKQRQDNEDLSQKRTVAQDEEGFGFPRKNGKTGDIFDVKQPHTHVRTVAGLAVPLTEENYRTKTDTEIYEQLEKLKLV